MSNKHPTRWLVLLSVLSGLAACVLLLLIPELGIRYLHPYLPRDLKTVWIRSQLLPRAHRPHPQLLWAPDPTLALNYPDRGFNWRIQHVPYPNDPAVGYRASAPAHAPVDLVVLGDSYTYGFEVDQDKTWVEILKRSTGLTAVNTAVTSYGTSQEALVYKLYGRFFKPRMVLQVIVPNDPLDNVYFNEFNAKKDLRMLPVCWHLGLAQGSPACRATAWVTHHSIVAGILVFQMQALMKNFRIDDSASMGKGSDMICDDIKFVRSATRPQGIKYGVVMLGQWNGPALRTYRNGLYSCMKENGVPFLQLDERRESKKIGERYFGRFDWHWNETGHEYVAARIRDFLLAQNWLKPAGGVGRPATAPAAP